MSTPSTEEFIAEMERDLSDLSEIEIKRLIAELRSALALIAAHKIRPRGKSVLPVIVALEADNARLREALKTINHHWANHDMNHEDFRVMCAQLPNRSWGRHETLRSAWL